jgi:hypothetical protein
MRKPVCGKARGSLPLVEGVGETEGVGAGVGTGKRSGAAEGVGDGASVVRVAWTVVVGILAAGRAVG